MAQVLLNTGHESLMRRYFIWEVMPGDSNKETKEGRKPTLKLIIRQYQHHHQQQNCS